MYSGILIAFMVITIIALFVLMIIAANAAAKSTDTKNTCPNYCDPSTCDPTKPNKCQAACHTWSAWTAGGCGIVIALVIVCLIIYLYSNKTLIHEDVKSGIQQVGQGFQQFGQGIQSYGK